MPIIKCYLYDIVAPDPDALGEDIWQKVYKTMELSKLMGEKDKRFGIISVIQFENMISGFFIKEGQKQVIQYTDDKEPFVPPNTTSFENLFFIIFSDTSQILLQQKNIYDFTNLGLPVMRNEFLNMVTDFIKYNGVYYSKDQIIIEPASSGYSQEELIAFFLENSTIEIKIDNLQIEKIPNDNESKYKLYNPHDDWNLITWEAVKSTVKTGAKKVSFETNEDANSALNKGPLPKAFAYIGEVQEVKAKDKAGNIVFRKKTGGDEIVIDIPSDTDNTIPALETVLRWSDQQERVITWQARRKRKKAQEYDGTLFEDK